MRSQTPKNPIMFRLFAALLVSAFAFLSVSCCCTSDSKPAPLRPLPQFQEMPAAEVDYSK
jgi:hypothetical protein